MSAVRISSMRNLQIRVHWTPRYDFLPGVYPDFKSLFSSPDFITLDQPPKDPFFTWRLFVSEDEIPAEWSKIRFAAEVGGRAIDGEYERIPAAIREEYLKILKLFRPQQQFINRAAEIIQGRKFVGVHIREHVDWPGDRRVSLDHYFKYMDDFPQETLFYLAAPNKAVTESVVNRYGSRVFFQEDPDYYVLTTDSVRCGLIDLLVLAQAEALVLTHLSTFSELAWWLGGCKQPISDVK